MANDPSKLPSDNANESVASQIQLNLPSHSNTYGHSSNSSVNVIIESLSDDNSSVVDSDSDLDEIPRSALDFFKNRAICTSNANQSVGQSNGVIGITENIAKIIESDKPSIGSIVLQNPSDITFGNKTFYQGPVTIQQFSLKKTRWRLADSGIDNKSFESTNGDASKGAPAKNHVTSHSNETKSGQEKWRDKILAANRVILISFIITGTAASIGAVVFTNLTKADSNKYPENDTSLRFVSRSMWFAETPNSDLDNLELPSKRCTTQAMCVPLVRSMQTFHMESKGWDDISYNFLVSGDGSVYEGRGWDKQGAHTKGFNKGSICIAFIGTFNKLIPPKRQLFAAQMLIEQGVKLKKLIPDYQLYGHRQLMSTDSPGAALYNIIKTWSHWSHSINYT